MYFILFKKRFSVNAEILRRARTFFIKKETSTQTYLTPL